MHRLTEILRLPHLGIVPVAIAFGIAAWAAPSAPATARVFVGIGIPFPGYYAPYPNYPPPAYYPYYAPAPAYYPPPEAYSPPAAAYSPPPGPSAAPAAAPATSDAITYTTRPAFRNAAGQTCREFQAAGGALGNACQDSDGQWRVSN
ncbi:MAG TPA: hypothetical protein VGS13_06890 [Stellaceae bacterium]|nr:hypothetical protein [Stellaceae bacterium]